MPHITRPQVYRVVREMLPRERFGPEELLIWLEDTQLRNERARRSHQRRRYACRKGRPEPPPQTRRCSTKLKSRWDVHMAGGGDRYEGYAGAPLLLIAGWSGSGA